MIFDGFFIYHMIKELNNNLIRSRLEKIYQTSEMSFVFVFYHRGIRNHLKLSLSPHDFGMHLTASKTRSTVSSQFLTSLKKHLEGSILESISQYKTDRVITFRFASSDFIDGPTEKTLIFEAMGKHSNLVIVKDGLIIDTFKKMFFIEGRQLLPKAKFEFFPSEKKPFFNIDYYTISSYKELVENYLGISPFLAKYLFENQVNLADIAVNPTRNIELAKDYAFDIFPDTDNKKHYQSLSQMIDSRELKVASSTSSHQTFIKQQLKKFYTKKDRFDDLLVKASKNLESKHKGDLIYQSGLDLKQHVSSLTVCGTTIVVDPTKTLNENAQLFFKVYQKAKRSIDHLVEQNKKNDALIKLFIEFETYLELSKAESLIDFETALVPFGFKKAQKRPSTNKKSKKPHILTIVDNDTTYYVGKNSLQNEYITHKIGRKDDYWFHVKDAPGGHIVVNQSHLSEVVLRTAAMLAAHFSSLKYSSSIPVNYTKIKYLKKIPGAPGYTLRYSNHKTIYIDIDLEKISSHLK